MIQLTGDFLMFFAVALVVICWGGFIFGLFAWILLSVFNLLENIFNKKS